ncbi:MAG: hypothetical protein KJ773_09615, partial [Candidatus Thermoplasmatota archaeon]|nr:hypothetical protein [Candidatus Thermoplasmatota archaeon]
MKEVYAEESFYYLVMKLLDFKDVLKTYKSEKHGKEILEKYRKWFPLYASKELSGLVADLMCDGHLQGYPKLRFDYISKYPKELMRFEKILYNLFGIKGKIRHVDGNEFGTSFIYGVNCKPLARLLLTVGVPHGAKVLKEFRIPKWILEDKEYFREFVRRAYLCEGSFYKKDFFIGLQFYKADYLKDNGFEFVGDIRNNMIKHFGIRCSRVYTYKAKCIRKDDIKTIPNKMKSAVISRVKILAKMNIAERHL